ncbi:SLC13 family permease [Candidatus Bipolaricaulota bacterium]
MSASFWPIALSTAIFLLTYAGILTERLHRSLVVLLGAIAMVAIGAWLSFYSPAQAVEATDTNTIALLLGMMVFVGLFRATGLFEYLAIKSAKLARGKPWLLFIYLGLATTIVSMVLDNVTTVILMIPITMSLADILGVPVIPFLLSEVMLSNIGGVATLIGDPPNVLIGSAAGLSFTDFITHLAPIVLITWVVAMGLLLFFFRKSLARKPENIDRLLAMDERTAITDPRATRRLLAVLTATVALFFVHELIRLESGTVALLGASVALLLTWPDPRRALGKVHWDVLLFFIGLFVIVGGLEAAGTLEILATAIASLTTHGVIVASLTILWTSALMSALVDNVPFTIAMLPILAGIEAQGVSVGPLWWALALGVGFGGNATPVGATANVIVIACSEKSGIPITSRAWIRRGLPTALVACSVASVLDILAIRLGLF